MNGEGILFRRLRKSVTSPVLFVFSRAFERSGGVAIFTYLPALMPRHYRRFHMRTPSYKMLVYGLFGWPFINDVRVPLVDGLVFSCGLRYADGDGVVANSAFYGKPVKVVVAGAKIILDNVFAATALYHEKVLVHFYFVCPDKADGVLAPGAE